MNTPDTAKALYSRGQRVDERDVGRLSWSMSLGQAGCVQSAWQASQPGSPALLRNRRTKGVVVQPAEWVLDHLASLRDGVRGAAEEAADTVGDDTRTGRTTTAAW